MPILLNDDRLQIKTQTTSIINNIYKQMIEAYTTGMKNVWESDGISPQEVFNAFGTEAGELKRLAAIIKTAINQAKPNTIPDAPVSLVFNPDGTVTVQL